MSRELLVASTAGTVVYAVARIATGDNFGLWFNNTDNSLVVFEAAAWNRYAIPMTELGTTGLFEADMPNSLLNERAIDIYYVVQAGATPALGDTRISGKLYEMQDEFVPVKALDV